MGEIVIRGDIRTQSVLHHLPATSLLVFAVFTAQAGIEPPPAVLSPLESTRAFEIAETGCRIELVACEPMVQDPVAIHFDGEGRLWVVEMRGYMQDIDRSGVHDPIGRVSVLEDIDGDGVMDKSTVFLDGLVLPRAVAVHPAGVLIAENEPLWFAEDLDGDLVADRKTLIDPNYAKDDIEHSANGLLRAMDNWIYNAKEGHRYRREGDAWIREETEARGQWGISQDDWGRLYYNYNHSQLHSDLVPPNTLTRNPNHEPSTGLSVGVTATNAVFPIRPNRATNRGYIPGALDGEGRIQEFTSACAPFVYRESLFPEFAGNAFVCETAGNLVKRNILVDDGVRVTGVPAYPDRDFIASTDERFRPCWITSGPDGAIYLADMYRGIVQDGVHMSPYLREQSELRKMDKPIHLGRIWRVVPVGFQPPERPSFSNMSGDELVAHLANSSGWWRDQAQMHLVDRRLVTAIPALRQMALSDVDPSARLHALWTLEGLGDPEPEKLVPVLDDAEPRLQAASLRVLRSLGVLDVVLQSRIARQAKASPSQEVALQMILTLGDLKMEDADRFALMKDLVTPWMGDPLMRDALMSGLADREIGFLDFLLASSNSDSMETSGLEFLVESLAQAISKSREPKAIAKMLSHVETEALDSRQRAVLAGITIHRAALMMEPVKLEAEPPSARFHPELQPLFAWPGHVPPPVERSAVNPLNPPQQKLFVQGRQIFLTTCFACHGADGQGVKFLAPPLAGSDWVNGSPARLSRVLFHGLSGPITVSGRRYDIPEIQPVMPPLAALGNTEIAAVLTYIRRAWGNTADPLTPGDINKLRIESQGRTVPWTEAELVPFDFEGGEAPETSKSTSH